MSDLPQARCDSPAALLGMYEEMLTIRRVEEMISTLYRDGEVPGFVHLSIGQEAVAVGACWHLDRRDVIVSTHRGHGHCLAKGMRPEDLLAELLGRENGACSGRGGSMHVADPDLGIFGANGIVGAGLPIGVGAALAARLAGSDAITIVFFGDGVPPQGAFHEAVNFAITLDLRIIFLCENNHFAEFTRSDEFQPVGLAQRAHGYGIKYVAVDGNDVEQVAVTLASEIDIVRRDGHPVMIEADTYRLRGHYEGDPERYRTTDQVEGARQHDPIDRARRRLIASGISTERIDQVDQAVEARVMNAVDSARRSNPPQPSGVLAHVYGNDPDPTPFELEIDGSEEFRYMDAIREALEVEMSERPEVFVLGIDVGESGNVFGVLRGLHAAYPDRVIDTPISESAIVGSGVGASMAGFRPVVEVMYMDFIGVCFDQIMNQAAKLHFMTGGKASTSLTIRTQFGAGRSSGSQHSQSLEALLAHLPGLKVVMPSNPADAYGLLRSAIADPSPVVFVENRLLYGQRGPKPQREHRVPIGSAKITRPGDHVTLVSWSRLHNIALEAAETAGQHGISTEVIDARSISPFDWTTVLQSIKKTGRLIVAHEAVAEFGVGAEIAARAADEAFWDLDAPVSRVGAKFAPAPYSPGLEAEWLPGHDDIVEAILATARA